MKIKEASKFIPLLRFLGTREDNAELNGFLAQFGAKPEICVVEHTSSLSYKQAGFSLDFIEQEWVVPDSRAFEKGIRVLRAVFLYSNGCDGFRQYQGPLLCDLLLSDTRSNIQRKLGQPSVSGGGNKGPSNMVWPLWDRYDFEDFSMRVDYSEGVQNIRTITLMTMFETRRLGRAQTIVSNES